ncbi:RDD family protein [Massilia sp. TSP1-1-2]|uniref:RDD family protein n=1 Tax=unclassified Massilia TaxID=2609279 RepID=UPI003CF158F7
MSQTDPYSPPQSSLGGLTPSEQYAKDSGQRYSRFWDRVGAALIDFLIALPLMGLNFFFGGETRLFQLYLLVPVQILTLTMHVYMVVKHGGSPGKMLVGLRIAKLDGSPATLKEAALRYSVLWVFGLASAAMTLSAAMGMSEADYAALSYTERSVALSEQSPYIFWVGALMQVWVWGNLITVLANDKRRALHDFLAGTVVLRK